MGISPQAIVGSRAKLGRDVEVGPFAIVEDGATIGDRVKIWPHAYICRGATVADDVKIHMGAVIGHEPQDVAFEGKESFTRIGKRTVIREYATVHRGTKEGTTTEIGEDCFLMAVSHVGHNCRVGNKVIVANGALLAGHVHVDDGAFISGNVVVHQFCRIGCLAMIGGYTGINQDVPPYMLVRGPSVVRSLNLVGIRRAKMSKESFESIKAAFKALYLSGLNTSRALEEMRKMKPTAELGRIVAFVESSKRGICSYRSGTEEFFG